MHQAAKPLRRHGVGAESAATFTPRPLPAGEGARTFSQQSEQLPMLLRVWIICLCVWLMSHAYLPSLQAQTNARPPAASLTTPPEPCPSASPDEQNRVLLQAETLEYLQPTKRVVATGNVRVIYGDRRLFADQLELHTDTNTGTAWGHVRFITP